MEKFRRPRLTLRDSDYTYVLNHCLEETTAPYIAVFEDDIIFAEGWLSKTVTALGNLRQQSKSWLYLRLFYTETSLGWDASVDYWYGHLPLTFVLAMAFGLSGLLFLRTIYKPARRHIDNSSLTVVTLVTIPAFTALVFMIGKYSLFPLQGVERMDVHGCCTQALVFPRIQVPDLINFLRERREGQTDSLIEEYADKTPLERYALAPQVVQHVGLISSRNNLEVNTKSTWAFWFEASDADALRKEHDELARWGIWRASGDGYNL